MLYARILGSLWATVQVAGFEGRSLKLIEPVDARTGKGAGDTLLAVDLVGARKGDHVLVIYEGSSSRLAMGNQTTPCEAIVVGIVDRLDLESEESGGH